MNIRITLEDGRWIELRKMEVGPFLMLQEMLEADEAMDDDEEDTPERRIQRVRTYRDMMNVSLAGTSWGGDADGVPLDEQQSVITRWLQGTRDELVPPESGPSSESISQASGPDAPTHEQSTSRRRGATASSRSRADSPSRPGKSSTLTVLRPSKSGQTG